jgi:hypothetical protein
MRRDALDKAGGFPAFGCYLAEDFFFAKSIQVISSLSSGATWQRSVSLPKVFR